MRDSLLRRSVAALVLAGLGSLLGQAATAAEVTGAGSTFVFPVLSSWASQYDMETGDQVSYRSIGSGAGIGNIKAAAVDFGASDMPLRPEELAALGLGQFPLVVGGVVPVVHLDGVEPGTMRFTGALLADIYLGKIKRWNDPAIRKLNPSLRLPEASISLVHRSDGSGTTFNWVDYLSKVSPEWKRTVGAATSVAWPGGLGAKGNEGVAVYVNHIRNSIGYVEYAYVRLYNLTYALVANRAGNYVQPGPESFQAAAVSADWGHSRDFFVVLTDSPAAQAYPVTGTTFVLMYKRPKGAGSAARAKVCLEFFKWALESGQKQADALHYVPLPGALVEQVERYWKAELSF